MDFSIFGLGNPGEQYSRTRHNVGFMFLDYLATRLGASFSPDKWGGLSVSCRSWGGRVYLVKPQTFMNRSGRTVAGLVNYYDIPADRILVVHDDIDMHPGRVKLVFGGGTGGHNGIKSIVQHLGDPEFFRLKVGIGRPGAGDVHADIPVDKYVLSRFSAAEMTLIDERFDVLEEGVGLVAQGEPARATTLLNSLR